MITFRALHGLILGKLNPCGTKPEILQLFIVRFRQSMRSVIVGAKSGIAGGTIC